MLSDVVDLLRCPHCEDERELHLDERVLRCAAGHSFDVSRRGYVSLLPGNSKADAGDTRQMINARERFLASGHYDGLAQRIAMFAADSAPDGCVVESGAGTGFYLARVLDELEGVAGVALDASKHAARRAVKAHPRIGAVTCDVWRGLPVRSGVASLVLDVFAPRNGAEFARILRPDGTLVVVTPDQKHLAELVASFDLLTVDDRKDDRVARSLDAHFVETDTQQFEERMLVGHTDLVSLAAMGPSAWHVTPDELAERARALPDPMPVTCAVTMRRMQRR